MLDTAVRVSYCETCCTTQKGAKVGCTAVPEMSKYSQRAPNVGFLQIHPLVLGKGRRFFPDGSPLTNFRLVDSVTTGTGVIIATYRPASPRYSGLEDIDDPA